MEQPITNTSVHILFYCRRRSIFLPERLSTPLASGMPEELIFPPPVILKCYLENSTNTVNAKSTTWSTAIAGMSNTYNGAFDPSARRNG